MENLEQTIRKIVADRSLLSEPSHRAAVLETIRLLDVGSIRVAERRDVGEWIVNDWIKHAILFYFSIAELKTFEAGPFEHYDKIPPKRSFAELGVRVVPPAIARYGSFLERGVILMPSFVNIGAYVGAGTMVDTWATVGSCAQIGSNVHLSGGVGIGGVLEPPSARPVIVEDGAFIGSRCIVVEGAIIEEEAVLGANVTVTSSTAIIDVTGPEPVTYKGRVPARSVVIPGSRRKQYPAGEFEINCALIIGKRKPSTDQKTSLNDVLREFAVEV